MSAPKTVRTEILTVGDLRRAIEGVPDERSVVPQVVGEESGVWNMRATFLPAVAYGSIAVLVLSHPDLKSLPMEWGPPSLRCDPTSGTVRVRIAVAVDSRGNYVAYGKTGVRGEPIVRDTKGRAKKEGEFAVHYVEADVPLPFAPVVVEGTVISAEEE